MGSPGPGFDVQTDVLVRLAKHLCKVDAPRIRAVAASPLGESVVIPSSAWGHVEFLDLEGVGRAYERARANTVEQLNDVADHLCPMISLMLESTARGYTDAEDASGAAIGAAGTGL